MLQAAMWPQLTEQDLHTVREIEDAVIPVVVEMEHNGAPLDVELLEPLGQRERPRPGQPAHAIKKGTGIEFEKFTNREPRLRLFRVLHIDPPLDPESRTTRRRASRTTRSRTRC
jgi:hypothetical protein